MSRSATYDRLMAEAKAEYDAVMAGAVNLPDVCGLYRRAGIAEPEPFRPKRQPRLAGHGRVRPMAERDAEIVRRYERETAAAIARSLGLTTQAIRRVLRVARERGLAVPRPSRRPDRCQPQEQAA